MLGQETLQAFEDISPTPYTSGIHGVVGIGVNCLAGPDRPDLTIKAVAKHAYYIKTSENSYIKRGVTMVLPEQRGSAAIAASSLLGDEFLAFHLHSLRKRTRVPNKDAGSVHYEYIQLRHSCLLVRKDVDIASEFEDLQVKGLGLEELVAGMVVIGFPMRSISGHEILSDLKIAASLIQTELLSIIANQNRDVQKSLKEASFAITILTPDPALAP
jgi:hypothetical protein